MMKQPIMSGLSFGLTSGIITTLGLIVGLNSGTHLRLAVIGGILTIAIADAFSDALGMHITEESRQKHNLKGIWQATGATFFSKLFFALTFLVPVLLLDLETAIIASIIWGLLALGVLSYKIALAEKEKPWKVISEHLLIAIVVVVLSQLVGELIGRVFG